MFDTLKKKLIESQDWLLSTGLHIFLILVIMLVLLKLTSVLEKKLSTLLSKNKWDNEHKKRADTLSSVIRHIVNVIILASAGITILDRIGIEIGPILAAAGVVGVAVGFGAQNLIKDVINGFFILLEDQIRVGDVVQAGGQGGLVEKMNLRLVVLRDLAGNVHYIPNGSISVVTNMTKDYSRFVFDIGVAYRENVDEVIELIKKVDESLRQDEEFKYDILEPIEILGLDQFADSAVIIKARTKTKPIQQWRVGREFNRRLKQIFDENDIEIPFPHVTLYPGQDKDKGAPALFIKNADREQPVVSEPTQSGKSIPDPGPASGTPDPDDNES